MKLTPSIYWMHYQFEDWGLYLAATEQGLCYVGSQGADFQELEDWVNRRFPRAVLVHDEVRLRPYAAELTAYFQGRLSRFSVPYDLRGTAFQSAVWAALCQIPYGQTSSYSDIAALIGKPSSVRAVGSAIGANPVLITVPCHRVVGKNGALTGYRGGLEMKARLLELERK
ncbi:MULTISPECIES: methylated-DNA--[protein]-cysteine S-methyltransferase [Paenibacillus]|uniref:methylated-DNA--[protein]-cysteine S-methyltransferase n=1 Tax=Paenibacillus TaxID=44249 RepID=UPI002FE1B7DF